LSTRNQLLVFDLDGTLVDSTRDLAAATNAALQRVAPGQPALPVQTVLGFVGNGARVLIEKTLQHAGVDRPADDVLPVFLECYDRCLLDTTRPYPGIPEALGALEGYPLAVLTNKPGPLARKLLEGLGLAARFARIWGPGDVPERKPSPTGLQRLIEELGATPETAWMIGDSPVDVRTARAAGVRIAGVTWGLAPDDLVREQPDRLIDDARDLLSLASA
jgi:phosphoglycolate phosphatase